MFDLESDVRYFEVTSWSCFLMEGVSTWRQVEIFRLTSFWSPAFYGCAFCLIALEDLDLSTCDFCSTKVNFTESNGFWTIIVFIRYCNSWAVGYDLVVFTLRVFLADIGYFYCSVSFHFESNICYFEVAGWSGFLMEGVSTWRQVEIFRLTSFWSPAFYGCAFCLIALEDLDLSTCDFCSTKVNFTESNGFWTIIVFIRYCNSWAVGYDLVVFTLRVFLADIGYFYCSVSFHFESNICYFEVAGWSGFLMESISTWCQVQVFRLTSFWSPAFYGCAFCFIALVDLDLSTCDFCSTKANLAKGNLTWAIVIFISDFDCWTISYDCIVLAFSILGTNIGNFNCAIIVNLESDIRYFEVSSWGCFLMEGVSTWGQAQFFRLTSFWSPAFYSCAFCLIAFEDLDLCSCDFNSTKTNFTERDFTSYIVIFISNCQSWILGYNTIVFTFRIFFTYFCHFNSTVRFNLESDIRYFEVTSWGCFLMESVDAWFKIQLLRLVSWSPAFYGCAFCLVALVDLNLSTSDFISSKIDFTEGNSLWSCILFVSDWQNRTSCYDSICCTFFDNCNRTISIDREGNIINILIPIWSNGLC